MSSPTLVGVDPGGRNTGIVVRQGDNLLDHLTLVRQGKGELPDQPYLRQVALTLIRLVDRFGATGVGVEGVKGPSPFMGASGNVKFANVTGILGTAAVWGAVLALLPAVVVPPAKNGSGPLGSYPPELRPHRGQGRGKDGLRHERSAWDIAGVAAKLLAPVAVSA